MPNYNVINSYLPFALFSFFYDNIIAIRCMYKKILLPQPTPNPPPPTVGVYILVP